MDDSFLVLVEAGGRSKVDTGCVAIFATAFKCWLAGLVDHMDRFRGRQGIRGVAVVALLAWVAAGTVPSVEALICVPVSEPLWTFEPVIAPFLILCRGQRRCS